MVNADLVQEVPGDPKAIALVVVTLAAAARDVGRAETAAHGLKGLARDELADARDNNEWASPGWKYAAKVVGETVVVSRLVAGKPEKRHRLASPDLGDWTVERWDRKWVQVREDITFAEAVEYMVKGGAVLGNAAQWVSCSPGNFRGTVSICTAGNSKFTFSIDLAIKRANEPSRTWADNLHRLRSKGIIPVVPVSDIFLVAGRPEDSLATSARATRPSDSGRPARSHRRCCR